MPKRRRSEASRKGWKKRKQASDMRIRKQWTDEAMIKAIQAAKSGEMGVNRAALEFGVPKTTFER